MNYLKADLFRIRKEKKLLLSSSIAIILSFLFAFFLQSLEGKEITSPLIQILSQFIPLFFLAPSNLILGDDFQHRTLNNLVAKTQNRGSIFFYKITANLLAGFLYIVVTYGAAGLFQMILGGNVDWGLIVSIFTHQVPLYSCVILLLSCLFIWFKKTSQAYLTFILLLFFWDGVVSLLFNTTLGLPAPESLQIFFSLQSIPTSWTGASLTGLLFTILYLGLAYYLFQHKELY